MSWQAATCCHTRPYYYYKNTALSQIILCLYSPLKDFPQEGVLDPLNAVNFALGHSALKQHLNHVIFLLRFGDWYKLKDRANKQVTDEWYTFIFIVQRTKFGTNSIIKHEMLSMEIPCIQILARHSCPSGEGNFLWWRSWSCVKIHYKQDKHHWLAQISSSRKLCCKDNSKSLSQEIKNTSSASPPHHEQTQSEASFESLSWFCTLDSADTSPVLLVHLWSGEHTAAGQQWMEPPWICPPSTYSPEWESWQRLGCHHYSADKQPERTAISQGKTHRCWNPELSV